MTDITDIIAAAPEPIAYADADTGDLVAKFLAHTIGGRYSSSGEFILSVAIPADVFNPHDLMGSSGMMLYWEARKC